MTWIDGFLFWDLFLVTFLIFADWLLGKEKRAAMRGKVGEWWLYLQDISFAGLVAEDAGKIRTFLEKLFGKRIFSFRRFAASILFGLSSLLVFGPLIKLLFVLASGLLPHGQFELLLTIVAFYYYTLLVFPVGIILPTLFCIWASISVSIVFLRFMESSVSMRRLLLLIVLDLVSTLVLAVSTALVQQMLVFKIGLNDAIDTLVIRSFEILTLSPDEPMSPLAGIAYDLYITMLVVVFTSLLPTLVHLSVTGIFVLSKWFRPILQKPVGILLLRFHESEKGVLTQLAVALGTIAKFVQLGIKYVYAT